MKKNSMFWRALIAILLFIGFYILSISIAFILFYIPYAEWVYTDRINFRIALFCIIGGVIILWSIIPKRIKFIAPGLRLVPEKNPKLFDEINDIARKLNQRFPTEVYLIPDVNAWVSQRGGFMGIGSKRIMGIGLPLLQILSKSEFKAILAHEFGHYSSGDTGLEPWIYKTRSTIERTLQGLSGHSGFLQKPFIMYGNLFLRITHSISRHQEYIADETAAKMIGSLPFISGLKKICSTSVAYHAYWNSELAPALDLGYLPPYAKGFKLFIDAEPIKNNIATSLQEELESGQASPYDTHPSLKERLSALESIQTEQVVTDNESAITLLANISDLEMELFKIIGGELALNLQPTDWNNIGEIVYLPQWEKLVEKQATNLKDLTVENLPEILKNLDEFGERLLKTANEILSYEKTKQYIASVLGASIIVALIKEGWLLKVEVGLPITLQSDKQLFEPFSMTQKLIHGEITEEEWIKTCNDLGISKIKLIGLKS